MPNKIYSYTVRGKDYDIPWDGPSAPTPYDVKQYIWEQDHPKQKGFLEDTWDKVMTPLTDLPSRAAKSMVDSSNQFYAEHPTPLAGATNTAGHITQGIGDFATGMTAPGQIGLALATGGESIAAKAGMSGLASSLAIPGRVAAAGMIGHGGYRMYEEPTWGGKAGGAVEAGLGLLGVRGRVTPEARAARAAKVADIGWAEDAAAAAESEAPRAQQRLLSGRVAPIEPPRGPTRPMGPSSLDPNIPIEGEIIPGPPQPRLGGQTLEQRNLPPLNNRGLPPARPTFYQGAGGTALDDIDAAGTPRVTYQGGRGLLPPDRAPVRNWSDARARIATPEPPLAPITAEPITPVQQPGPRDVLEQNSPYGMNYLRQQAPEAPPIQAPPVAPPPAARPVARPVAPPVVDIPPIEAPPVQPQRPPIVAGPMKAAPSVPIGDITPEIPGSTIPPIVDTAAETAPIAASPVTKPKTGRVKLYRWQPDDPAAAKGAGNWYVDNPKKIDFYRTDRGPGRIVAMELSPEQAERFRVPTDPAAPGFKADPNGEFYLPSDARKNVVRPQATAAPAERPYAKVSDGDIATLVKTGDAKAVAEAQARPNLWEKIKTWYKDPAQQKGSVDMRGMLGMDKEGTPSPISGATTSEAEVAAPKKPMSLRELLGFKGKGPEIDSETLPHAHNLDQWIDMVRQEDGVGDDIIQAAIKGAHRRGIDPTRSWGGLEELSDFMKDMEHARLNDPQDYAEMVKQGIIENPKFKALNQATERPRPDWKSEKGSWDMRGTFGGGEKPPVPPAEAAAPVASEIPEPVPPKSWREKLGLPASAKENPHAARFADWVNQLRAAKSEGQLVSKKFTDLDAGGFDTVKKFQKGDVSGRLGDARKYLDAKFQELTDAGVPLEHRQHYVTQIWKDDPSKVIETYRRLGLKPSMSLQRTFDTYEQGMAAGLTPKFDKMSDILGFYETRANKAIADRQYFNYLREKGFIRPKGKGELDWKTLDPDHFPSTAVKGKDGVVKILPETAPPELHRVISNYLADPEPIAEKWANRATFSKNLAMSTGVPWTGINAHGANIMARTILGNTKETGTALKYILHPNSGAKYIEENFQHIPAAVKAGLTISTEGHELGETLSKNLVDTGVNKVLGIHGKLFEDPLFQKIIPALKLKHWREMTEDLVKSGLTQEMASKRAATYTNDLYGGINWEAMGKNRDVQNWMRATILAPDWVKSNINLGKGLATGLNKKEYQKLAAGMVGAYISSDVVNYAQNGKHMWENPTGHALDIRLGKSSDGTDRYLRPFGTAADFARLPYEVGASMLQGNLGAGADMLKNRASIPLRTLADVGLNKGTNQLPIFNKDAYGRKIPMLEGNPKINRGQSQLGGLTREVAHLAAPPYAQALADYYLGKSNAEQAIVQGGELAPLRYTRPPSPKFKRGF